MTIEAAVCERLLSCSPVTALVAERISTVMLPQGSTLPAIYVAKVPGTHVPFHLRGPVNSRDSRVQVNSVGRSKAIAVAVAAAVEGDGLGVNASGLSGFKGDLGGSPAEIHIALARLIDEREDYFAQELKQYALQQDYMITWWIV